MPGCFPMWGPWNCKDVLRSWPKERNRRVSLWRDRKLTTRGIARRHIGDSEWAYLHKVAGSNFKRGALLPPRKHPNRRETDKPCVTGLQWWIGDCWRLLSRGDLPSCEDADINRNWNDDNGENRGVEDPRCWPTPAQESACILSDDYWAIIGRGAKK